MAQVHLAGETAADELLATDPLALLVGMLLDQQVPMERAFRAPYLLAERLAAGRGHGDPPHRLDPAEIVALPAEALEAVFAGPPALHRFPAAMARRTAALCSIVVDDYQGDAAAIWTRAATGPDLVRRLGALPGFGPQKARIFGALLGKQFAVTPPGWREATEPFGADGTTISVADVVDGDSLEAVRAYKKAAKAAKP